MDTPGSDARLAQLRREDLLPLTGARFHCQASDGTEHEWILREVRDEARPNRQHGPLGGRRPFSLFFQATSDVALAQGSYQLQNEAFPVLTIFLTPVLGRAGERWMQAVFN